MNSLHSKVSTRLFGCVIYELIFFAYAVNEAFHTDGWGYVWYPCGALIFARAAFNTYQTRREYADLQKASDDSAQGG